MILARFWRAMKACRPCRFSLRTLFAVLTIAGVWLGVLKHRADQQREVVAWLARQAIVEYDYAFDLDEPRWVGPGSSSYPDWLRNLVGDDFLHNVVNV